MADPGLAALDRPTPAGEADPRLRESARALESMLLKQIVVASGAFRGGEAAGAGIRADLFAQTLSDALVGGGGIGLAALLERSLGAGVEAAAPAARGGTEPSGPPRRAWLGAAPPAPAALALSEPVAGAPTSSPFGRRPDPFSGAPAHHAGLDLAAPEGTPVAASAPGVVVAAGPRSGYGLAVEVDHGHGITTVYAHASEVLVQPGQRVERGDVIARVGETGRATGPHLHFELRTLGRPVDPRRALSAYHRRADEHLGSGILTAER